MAWSPGNTKMYHMDSGLRKLWSFNFDDVSSCLTNRQVCWWTSTTRGWVSRTPCARTARGGCGGRGSLEPPLSWCDPAIGELLANIEFPAPHMMSCCFWGGGGGGGRGGGGGAPHMTSCCFRGPDVCHQNCTKIPFT